MLRPVRGAGAADALLPAALVALSFVPGIAHQGVDLAELPDDRNLDALGLAYLAEPWLLTVPGRDEPVTVRIVEVTPERMRVANADYGYEEADIGHVFVLEVPETGRLRAARG